MSILKANCPSCAGPVEFKAGSTIVIVCPFCRSVVARTDRALEDLGKVAEIVQTQSPLKVGLKGKYLGNGFELTGRAQLQHEAGGVWDEWYATFSNGWVGWLAEAQGRYYITFYQPVPQGTQIPGFANLQVGQPLPASLDGKTQFVVAEKGLATAIAAEGEIPYKLVPNEQNYYADLSGAGKAFATIDYGMNPPFVFVGKEATLEDLGLASARPAERAAPTVSAKKLACPNCGGPLDLKAPDAAERVTCPNCDSLLDVQQNGLKYLHALKPVAAETYVLNIGATGQLAGREPMQIIGAMTRSVDVYGTKYFWQEYLLYNPKVGFRWLVNSDGHWSFVEPLAPGDVSSSSFSDSAGSTVVYIGEGPAKDKTFKIFQHAQGAVEHVRGEFYWRVEVGERTMMTDYVNAPFMLSKEVTAAYTPQKGQPQQKASGGGEVNWSLGTYLTKKEVEKAFGAEYLPSPWNVAPNQPNPHKGVLWYGLAMLAVLFAVSIVLLPFTSGSRTVGTYNFNLPPLANAQAVQTQFSEPFELRANRNVRIEVIAPVNNSGLDVDVDLINEQNNSVEQVPLTVEYYSGVDGGEAWSEGSRTNYATLSALPAGKYSLRVEGNWAPNWQQPQPVTVTVRQNVTRGVNFCCALMLLGIVPLIGLILSFSFESRRWSESMFGATETDIHST